MPLAIRLEPLSNQRRCFCSMLALLLMTTTLRSLPGAHSPPVALASTDDGRMFVLQKDGVIVGIDAATGKVQGPVYEVPTSYQVVDMAAEIVQDRPTLCISIFRRDGDRDHAWLLQWTKTQKEIWTSLNNGIYTGIAIDRNSQTAFVASAARHEIVRARIGSTSVKYLTDVGNAGYLGPLVLDSQRNRLLVADTRRSVIYAVNLVDGKASELFSIPSAEIRALAVDHGGRRLFIADANGEAVWFVDLNRPNAHPEAYSHLAQFRTPAGVAIDHQGQVWVADQQARIVVKLAQDGKSADVIINW
jgi:hypothetical protein